MHNFKEWHESGTIPARGRNRFRKSVIVGVFSVLAVALTAGAILVYYIEKPSSVHEKLINSVDGERIVPVCTPTPDINKLDCYPDAPVTENQCLDRGCCYSKPDLEFPPLNVPYCYYPANYKGYSIVSYHETDRRIFVKLRKGHASGFPKDVANLNLLVSFLTDNTLRIKITDADAERYEVPLPLRYQTSDIVAPLYKVTLDKDSNVLTVSRSSTGTVVFQTNLSYLVYSDQFLQLSSNLPSQYVYGIGEHYEGVLRSVNWTRFTLLNSDLSPKPNHALYGSHPFHMALEEKGKASGVFLLNSNIMDIILQPTPAITFRPIGGILDFFIMLGPSPKDVTTQYSSIVGTTFMPPFWSLGFHLCRYGYNSLKKTEEAMDRTLRAGIPLDVQWNDIDYMDQYKDFTYDKTNFDGLPKFVDNLHAKGMRYIVIVDPGLSNVEKVYPPYDEGLDDDVFVKNENGSIFVGKVWTSGTTVYPDFSHPAAVSFWTRQLRRFYKDVKVDGIWIDMNEPSNFYNGGVDGCPDSSFENPQYIPGGNSLQTKTLCMTAKHHTSSHYNEHNLYAYKEAVATYEALKTIRNKRPFVISRASFAGQGVYGGHWSGDISSTWEDLRYSIRSMINFNLYAMPMIGSDICGFGGNTTIELCARWQVLGAFYPFSRNHNDRVSNDQDPVAMGPLVTQATLIALQKRYTLLPYLYTLFYRSHAFGDTVIRPLFLEYPEDTATYSIDEQFLWGSAIMIVPVLYPNTSSVDAYFPKGIWYDAVTATPSKSVGEKMKLGIPLGDIYISIKAGHIIPSRNPAQNTEAMRKNTFNLVVPFDENQHAEGELYWDDGDSLDTYENGFYSLIKFEANKGKLTSTPVQSFYNKDINLGQINMGGIDKIPSKVTVNGKECIAEEISKPVETMKKGIFGIGLPDNKTFKTGVNCQFGTLGNMFVIMLDNTSLLTPLSITWE